MMGRSLLCCLVVLFLVGCASQGGLQSESAFDTPETHYDLGMKALKSNQLDSAEQSFQRSLALAEGTKREFAPGHEGLGLVHLHRDQLDLAEQEFKDALDIDKNYAPAYIGLGRVYTVMGEYKDAFKQFDRALEKDPAAKEAPFYAAAAYEAQRLWDDAEAKYEQALQIDPQFMEANAAFAKLQAQRRSAAGMGEEYQQIARDEAIDRADLAVLFAKNLPLDQLFNPHKPDADQVFQTPDDMTKNQQSVKNRQIADIESHWAKPYIYDVLDYQLLELYPDGTFRPDEPISRAQYAMMVQEVLIKAQNDPQLATKFVGSISPFPDVMNSHYAFNSIMVATTRGIMSAKMEGTFGLNDPVSGAEGLLMVKKLNDELK